jgi:hypothetical protein
MDREDLLRLINDDDLGLLKIPPKRASTATADDRLISSFDEINKFVGEHGREPKVDPKNVKESQLFYRLKSIRESNEKIQALSDHDQQGLLIEAKKIKSIEDIYQDDDLGILESNAESIFTFEHAPKETTMPDYVARRKPCKDFDQFEHLFTECHAALGTEKRKILPFAKEQQIDKGLFFILKGIMLYIAEVGDREAVKGKVNARLRCIFENGTESDMLLRSLSAELYKDGRRVSEHEERLLAGLENITNDDEETGQIYVVKSLSEKEEIKSIENLYKIGFCQVPIEDRIKNAEKEPTYLMAPVAIVNSYLCYNLNVQKLELLLHTFFGNSCLSIDVFDNNGQRHTPREWFIAPLDVIEQAINFLISGEIVDYKYNSEKQEIVRK